MLSNKIFYGRHSINNDDKTSVLKVLKSNYLTQGPEVKIFEEKVKKKIGAKYAIATNSATSALHLACLAVGIKKNDIVWVASNGFVATSNCALYCNAKIKFIDIDANTGNISLKKLEDQLNKVKKKYLPKVLITVHFAGQPPEQDLIYKLSKKFNFKIIEDASHSLGAKYKNNNVGNCKWSDISVFSFHPVKIITTGEGGMCLTNNKRYARIIELLRTHGINRNLNAANKKQIPWGYQQESLGYNYRMSDIHASLGTSQLNRLNKFLNKRRLIARNYDIFFNKIKFFQPLKINNLALSSYHLYLVKFSKKNFQKKFFYFMKRKNIFLNIHYIPINIHPFYKKLKVKKNDIINWINFSRQTISLPIFYDLKLSTQKKILSFIKQFITINKL